MARLTTHARRKIRRAVERVTKKVARKQLPKKLDFVLYSAIIKIVNFKQNIL